VGAVICIEAEAVKVDPFTIEKISAARRRRWPDQALIDGRSRRGQCRERYFLTVRQRWSRSNASLRSASAWWALSTPPGRG
jgi:hypothetical protein